jgi:hypothetical protein
MCSHFPAGVFGQACHSRISWTGGHLCVVMQRLHLCKRQYNDIDSLCWPGRMILCRPIMARVSGCGNIWRMKLENGQAWVLRRNRWTNCVRNFCGHSPVNIYLLLELLAVPSNRARLQHAHLQSTSKRAYACSTLNSSGVLLDVLLTVRSEAFRHTIVHDRLRC